MVNVGCVVHTRPDYIRIYVHLLYVYRRLHVPCRRLKNNLKSISIYERKGALCQRKIELLPEVQFKKKTKRCLSPQINLVSLDRAYFSN